MIEDRSLQRPRDRHRESWNDLTSGASSSSAQVDRNALIVYQDADEQSGEPIVSQLLMKARITLPAVMNYLFFGSTQTAVVYFGKRVDEDGTKIGCINEGAEDFKVRMIRYLTSEMWPPLLRTDAPDESLGADLLTRSMLLADWQGPETLISGDSTVFADNEREKMQERFWLRRSLESNMQVLLYLKNGTVGGKYLKVILGNPSQRLHFDVIDIREEKYRWDLRMLFTRIMDNLETQKAIASYDSFLHLFREACAMADAHAMALERTSQQVPLLVWNELPEDSVDDFESLLRPTAPPVLDLFDEEDPATPPRTSGEDRSPENSTTQAPPSMEALSPLATRRPTGLKIAIASPSSPVLMDSERLPSFTPRVSSIMSMHSPGTELTPTHSTNRFYRWMERLEKPESATLDYKSYFSYPADEIKHRCVKFMCGFLNAYGEGKLVVGVHEIAHRDPDGNLVSEKEGRNNIVQHNDLVDQYVVGLRVSMEDLEEVQADVSKQLQRCLPPIPPQTVQLDVVPVQFPQNFTISRKILILYEQGSMYSISRDSLKQKSNYAIRFLYPLDLTIVPLGLVDSQLLRLVMDNVPPGTDLVPEYLKAEAYAIAAIHNPASLDNPNWETDLSSNLCGRTRCRHLFVDYGNGATELDFKLRVPQLHVVEVSVNIKRCGYAPLMDYKGKFFAGWPSIPMWDATTQSARRVERNYRLMISQDGDGSPSSSPQRAAGAGATSPASAAAAASASDGTVAMSSPRPKAKAKLGWRWFTDLKVVSRVLSYLYDHHNIEDTLAFRLIHPQCNKIFENRQGLHLVEMIQSTPVGVPVMSVSHDHISRMQGAFLSSGIPPLPLLLCRIYELIGNLPSPYPYVAVPLMQQTFRVAPVLIPLFYRQHYFDGQLRMAVVLDLRDGVMKTLELRDGNLILDAIVGMGFDRMNKRQVVQQLSQQACINPKKWMDLDLCSLTPSSFHLHPKRNYLARSLMGMRRSRSHNSSAVMSPLTSDQTRSFPREVEPDLPLLHFRFLTRQMLETQANNSNTTNFLDGAAVPQPSPCAHVPTNQRRVRSWTLQHLLMWNSSLLTDTAHVGFFGYCERSVAFRIARLKEICADDLEPSVLDGLASAQMEQLSLSSCAHECLIHQKVKEWMKV